MTGSSTGGPPSTTSTASTTATTALTAREEILARIVSATGADPVVPEVPRAYRRSAAVPPGDPALLDLLVDRLEDYKATVHRCPPERLARTVSAALTAREATRIVVPAGLELTWLTGWEGTALPDAADTRSAGTTGSTGSTGTGSSAGAGGPLDVATLDTMDGVVTGCAVAVAETGTLVLDGSPPCGRRAITLVPDYHLVVVHADQVVGSVPEGLARLDPQRPLTLISGPSATSDIELNRVEGVHGPRTLVVVLVE